MTRAFAALLVPLLACSRADAGDELASDASSGDGSSSAGLGETDSGSAS